MASDVRLSAQSLDLLSALLEAPSDWHYGYDLSRRTELKSGTLYPILMRLTEHEWLETKWEFANDRGRPRHMYRLTATGRRSARIAVSESKKNPLPMRPHPAR
jgi:PadR family transcriptional regulator, regulatory protein PadR